MEVYEKYLFGRTRRFDFTKLGMEQNVCLLDLFAGIGGFALGLKEGGFNLREHYFSEVNKWAIGIYQYQFRKAKYVGAVESIQDRRIKKPNIITFGSPCQDFSMAGQRHGLEGKESHLIWQAIKLIDKFRPDLFIWENVKGVFTSKAGRDFYAIIQAFANLGGYRLEWQLLNTSWFLPQNRERIYLIGHLGGRSFPKVFPFRDKDQVFGKKAYPSKRRTEAKDNKLVKTINTRGGQTSDGTYLNYSLREFNTNQMVGFPPDKCVENNYTSQGQFKSLRRLTEIECERLQGFPDNWTRMGLLEKGEVEISGTQRYHALGNAVSVPPVKEIAKRLLK